jgi:hypothetical protein
MKKYTQIAQMLILFITVLLFIISLFVPSLKFFVSLFIVILGFIMSLNYFLEKKKPLGIIFLVLSSFMLTSLIFNL